jgi:hypothetical protein
MHLFIDTNILLSFYALNQDDLGELGKLADRIASKDVTLLITEQIMDEFYRNREQRIEGALKSFSAQTFNPQFPQLCEDYPEAAERLRGALKDYERAHSSLLEKIAIDIRAKNLVADRLVHQLFSSGHKISFTPELVESARLRMGLGNPPGKNNSLGDAINWECLIATVPDRTDLFFISGDKDYSSPIAEEEMSGFLRDEWERRKESKIRFYRRISAFFKEQLPDIGMASLRDRDYLVRELSNGQSIADVQKTIARLMGYKEFTAGQANGIVIAVLNNQRVTWAIEEEGLRDFLQDLLTRYGHYLEPEMGDRLGLLLSPQE